MDFPSGPRKVTIVERWPLVDGRLYMAAILSHSISRMLLTVVIPPNSNTRSDWRRTRHVSWVKTHKLPRGAEFTKHLSQNMSHEIQLVWIRGSRSKDKIASIFNATLCALLLQTCPCYNKILCLSLLHVQKLVLFLQSSVFCLILNRLIILFLSHLV